MVKRKRKHIQVSLIFHWFFQSKPMIEYEQMQFLFAIFKVPNQLSKHQNDCIGWEIIENIHNLVLNGINKFFLAPSFLSISTYEMTIIDNWRWISIHYYMVASWRWVPILLTLEQFIESGIAINIKTLIFVTLMKFGGLFKYQVAQTFMCF